ncbi:MAG: cysteine desulfurase [Lachnospiraceae bacterium]|nr:cysteine desulfurase [Lachnospiraceae bacterium]
MEIYLDNSATTKVYPEVAQFMTKVMCEDYGNPSSMHTKGLEAEKYIKESKDIFSKILKCDPKNIYFTSGGTESDNLAIIGSAQAYKRRGKHLITTAIEHPAVTNTFKYLEGEGFEVTYLPVNELGVVSPETLKAALRDDTILVSVMHTNNEIGSLMPIEEMGKIIKEKNPEIIFHVDAVQGFGKAQIQPKKMDIDLLSVSSHKIHGPKGMGVLYVGDKVRLLPISYGGGQQGGLRSGTENVPGIAGMGLAAKKIYDNLSTDIERMYALKEMLIRGALEMGNVKVNGVNPDLSDIRKTAPHIVSLSFEGIRAEVLLHALEEKGVYVSAGSACSTHKPEPSATLKAIGLEKELLDCTLRFSMSELTDEDEIKQTLKALEEILPFLRRFVRK